MKFKYQAKNRQGEIQKGFIEAVSKNSATQICTEKGLQITSLEEIKESNLYAGVLRAWQGVKAKEFVIFSRQLATLIDSKVPLLSALHSISVQTENSFFALKIREIMAEVDGGSSFSEALSKHPDVFSKFYVNMVKAGEASGNLQKTLNDLADNIEKNYELTSKLKGAMYYPAFILSAMVVVGFVVMTFVMPKLLTILKEADVTLPIQTRMLIWVSDFCASYWWAIIIVAIAVIVGLTYYLKTEDGKRELDQIILKIPVLNKIFSNIYIARLAENLSTLVQSGLPITSALLITSDVVGNEVFRQVIREAAESIKKGGAIAETFAKYDIIPPVVTQMIKVGEDTGRIDFTLGKVTEFYMKESDNMVKNFSSLIEPIIMVILAIGVGILVSAVLLPIYQVASSIK
jgi:type IV pilus assembly protein PilC